MTNKLHVDFAGPAYEYLLIISPPSNVSTKIIDLKYEFKKYGCEDAIHSKPHVTLLNFIQSGCSGDRIANHLDRLLSSFAPVVVNMSGFGQFPAHTVFVNISTTDRLVRMVKDIRKRFGDLLKGYDKLPPLYTLTPHITIAKKMSKVQHDRAWSDWQGQNISGTFIADEITLLRREVSITQQRSCESFKIHKTFRLNGSGNCDVQLDLF